jgi:hypothetical protein
MLIVATQFSLTVDLDIPVLKQLPFDSHDGSTNQAKRKVWATCI